MEVIPVINCDTPECVVERLWKAKEFSEWVHVDISDGKFAPITVWGTPEEWQKLLAEEEFKGLNVEFHLMVESPEMVLDAWLRTGTNPNRGEDPLRAPYEVARAHSAPLLRTGRALAASNGARRVIIHLETMTDSVYILEKCKKYGAEAMLAIGPKTEVERLLAHEHDFKYFQVLSVFPGLQGQKFQESALEKIKFIRTHMPSAIIEVDGGMNLETAKLVKEAGADIIVSASYVFGGSDSKERFNNLRDL